MMAAALKRNAPPVMAERFARAEFDEPEAQDARATFAA